MNFVREEERTFRKFHTRIFKLTSISAISSFSFASFPHPTRYFNANQFEKVERHWNSSKIFINLFSLIRWKQILKLAVWPVAKIARYTGVESKKKCQKLGESGWIQREESNKVFSSFPMNASITRSRWNDLEQQLETSLWSRLSVPLAFTHRQTASDECWTRCVATRI